MSREHDYGEFGNELLDTVGDSWGIKDDLEKVRKAGLTQENKETWGYRDRAGNWHKREEPYYPYVSPSVGGGFAASRHYVKSEEESDAYHDIFNLIADGDEMSDEEYQKEMGLAQDRLKEAQENNESYQRVVYMRRLQNKINARIDVLEEKKRVKRKAVATRICPVCQSGLIVRSGKYGKFLACINSTKENNHGTYSLPIEKETSDE